MFRRLSLAALFSLLAVAPLAAQAGDWHLRVDRSANAADPDDVPDVTIEDMNGALRVATGPAAVVWRDGARATGAYTLSGTFVLESPSDHNNYYGLVFGGNELDNASQNYLYFLVAQNGTFIVKHRANDEAVHDIVGRTPHDAIVTPEDGGSATNQLAVVVGADQIQFMVNGTTVHTQPRQGMASRTDGTFGVRVNHRIPGVRVQGLQVATGM